MALLLTAPAQARNVIHWQCGASSVRFEVNKSTQPPTYDIVFEKVKPGQIVRTGALVWNTRSYVATVDGKRCREVQMDTTPKPQVATPPPPPPAAQLRPTAEFRATVVCVLGQAGVSLHQQTGQITPEAATDVAMAYAEKQCEVSSESDHSGDGHFCHLILGMARTLFWARDKKGPTIRPGLRATSK